MIRHLLFIAAFVSAIFASIPPQTNTPYAQVITESKENGTEIHYTYGNDLVGDGTHYFLTDALGSTRGLVDDVQTLTDSYDYKPYGELAIHTGTSENSFLFTGEQLDQETDNYYLRARYYSPSLSRFLSRDTYDGRDYEPITLNHYLYANANPVIYVDPSGHFTMMSTGFGIATISELYTVPNSVNFLFGGRTHTAPPVYYLHFTTEDYFTGALMVVTEIFTPGHGNVIELVNRLPFLSDKERNDFIVSAHIIWGMGYYPNAPVLTTMAQEAAFLLLAREAILANEINHILGKIND